MARRGAYFLADDGVFPWAAAFLCSFRRFNPHLPLCLIPYNERIEQLKELQHRYRFTIFDEQRVFDVCAQIADPFHPKYGQGHYRKFACWEGEFDEFVYLDIDTIVLADVGFVFNFLQQYDVIVASSNLPELTSWVWQPSIASTRALDPEQIAFSANTGFIVSRKPALPTSEVLARLGAAAALAPHMTLLCIEQPLLNYMFVTSGRPITSLVRLGQHLPQEWYAGRSGAAVRDGQLRFLGRSPLFVHWPGYKLPKQLLQKNAAPNVTGLHRVDSCADRKADLPYSALWKYYWDRA